ncbi:MAG: hypothetical protein H0W84_12930, partial [Bacteroidetes bacterium]|nr:hypothetical protein [Bacteroidota bacterium]
MKIFYSFSKLTIIFLLLFSFNVNMQAQTCPTCPSNLSFDAGNWSNWTLTNGSYSFALPTPVANPNYSYIAAGTGTTPRFTITSGTGFDPNITTLPVVAPCGGNYSARIGCSCNSEATGGAMPYAEWATYTLNVTAATAGFTYMYAAVLEDGTHDKFTQPQFEVIMSKCSDGSLLPCGQYAIYAGSGSAQFIQGPGKLQYTNWTSVSTDLTNYIGQQVCITFRVRDCMGNLSSSNGNYTAVSGGGHRGYAYFDTYCTPVQFTNPEFCSGAASLQICAPPGYATYSWPSGQPGLPGAPTTKCVTVNNPVSGTTYTVNMTSNGGCPVTMKVPISGIPVTTSTKNVTVCPGVASTLTVAASGTNTPYTYSWSNGLGTGTSVTVSPTVSTTYTVTVKNGSGCTSNEYFYINMKSCGSIITATGGVVCAGGCVNVTTTTSGGATPYTYTWNTGAVTSTLSACPASTTTYT